MTGQQLILNIRQSLSLDFASFIPGSNEQLLARLKQLAALKVRGFYCIWGNAGSGKSHLLQALCKRASDHGHSSIYLSGQQLASLPAEALERMENMDVVALDDIDSLLQDAEWEETLFHFYNRIQAQGNTFVVAAEQPPHQLKVDLPDLQSRLNAGETYQLRALEDAHKILFLKSAADLRGFTLGQDVAEFILLRAARDVQSLVAIVDLLDQSSLSEQRQVTVPFAKKILGL